MLETTLLGIKENIGMIGIELRSIVAFISLCVSLGCTPYYREAQSPSAIVFQPAETTAGIHPPPRALEYYEFMD